MSNSFLKARVGGYAVACPYCQANPIQCSLHEVRQLPVKDRMQWVCSLSDEELLRIIDFHNKCDIRLTEEGLLPASN